MIKELKENGNKVGLIGEGIKDEKEMRDEDVGI